MNTIDILGTLKKVDTKSKVGDDGRIYHHLTIGLELTDGVERVQDIVESLKELVSLTIRNKQPKLSLPEQKPLPITDHETRRMVSGPGKKKPKGR